MVRAAEMIKLGTDVGRPGSPISASLGSRRIAKGSGDDHGLGDPADVALLDGDHPDRGDERDDAEDRGDEEAVAVPMGLDGVERTDRRANFFRSK